MNTESVRDPVLESVLGPLRDTALETLRLLRHVGGRIDALSVDLARDLAP